MVNMGYKCAAENHFDIKKAMPTKARMTHPCDAQKLPGVGQIRTRPSQAGARASTHLSRDPHEVPVPPHSEDLVDAPLVDAEEVEREPEEDGNGKDVSCAPSSGEGAGAVGRCVGVERPDHGAGRSVRGGESEVSLKFVGMLQLVRVDVDGLTRTADAV